MAAVTIHYNFSDDSDDSNEFAACSGVLEEITDYADKMAGDKSEDSDEEVECEKWEVWETELDYSEQRDHDDFDDLDEWGEYCDLVGKHGEGFVLRNNNWNGHEDMEGYEGCWASKEEFVQNLVEDCYGFELPKFVYVDWKRTARDVMMDYSTYEGSDGIYIFRD